MWYIIHISLSFDQFIMFYKIIIVSQDCYMYYEILSFFLLSIEMPFTILTTLYISILNTVNIK